MKKSYVYEEWRPVKGYKGLYEVSNLGRVKSLPRNTTNGKILTSEITKNKYLRVVLSKEGDKPIHKLVHRLVAEAFIPNPYYLPQVNHKGEDPSKNYVWQLEWCTAKYNSNYGTHNERMSKTKINGKKSKIVLQYDLSGNFIKEYPSISEINRQFGYNIATISKCCLNKPHCKTAYGYIWKYKRDVN